MSKNDLITVKMKMTTRCLENAERIQNLVGLESKAQAIQQALEMSRAVTEITCTTPGCKLIIEKPNGKFVRIIVEQNSKTLLGLKSH